MNVTPTEEQNPFDFLVEQLIDIYPEEMQADILAGLVDMKMEFMRLCLEIYSMESKGLTFYQAARSPDFPIIKRLHFGVIDIIQFEIQPCHRYHLKTIFENVQKIDLEDLNRFMFCRAGQTDIDSGFFRFLIFQSIRLNVFLINWFDNGSIEAVGAIDAMDQEAERILRKRLQMIDMYDCAIRPTQIVFAEIMLRLKELYRDKINDLYTHNPATIEFFKSIADGFRFAKELNAADAAVLRNELNKGIGIECIGSLELSERHAFVLNSQNAVDQRRHRLTEKIKNDVQNRDDDAPIPVRREYVSERLIDVLLAS